MLVDIIDASTVFFEPCKTKGWNYNVIKYKIWYLVGSNICTKRSCFVCLLDFKTNNQTLLTIHRSITSIKANAFSSSPFQYLNIFFMLLKKRVLFTKTCFNNPSPLASAENLCYLRYEKNGLSCVVVTSIVLRPNISSVRL